MKVWDQPLRGAVYGGYYNAGTVSEDLQAAHEYGVRLLRLFFPAVHPGEGNLDFPGAMNSDDVSDWDSAYFQSKRFEQALQNLDRVIALAGQRGFHVILSPGLVPGSHGKGPTRWRLFRRDRWHWEFAAFWKRLAERYKENATVIGYLLLNEPGYEITQDLDFDDEQSLRAYDEQIEGTPADLNLLYQRTIEAIRKVDACTPIIIQPGHFARPQGLQFLDPVDDDRVLYAVHWYAPWLYTTWRHNRGRWKYPGDAPRATAGDPDQPGAMEAWNKDHHRGGLIEPVVQWQQRHGIPSSRILVSEFGVDRRVEGAVAWLRDVTSLLNEQGWHWTYYMFREREWDAMDQELGDDPENHDRRELTPAIRVIQKSLRE